LFNNSDKEVNFHKEYYNLIQEAKKFNEFYTQFQQLFSYLNYHKQSQRMQSQFLKKVIQSKQNESRRRINDDELHELQQC